MRMISRVCRMRCERTRDRSTSSVTSPPALRITCASPESKPKIRKMSMRESMQVTIAMRFVGMTARGPSKSASRAIAFPRSSSIADFTGTWFGERRITALARARTRNYTDVCFSRSPDSGFIPSAVRCSVESTTCPWTRRHLAFCIAPRRRFSQWPAPLGRRHVDRTGWIGVTRQVCRARQYRTSSFAGHDS